MREKFQAFVKEIFVLPVLHKYENNASSLCFILTGTVMQRIHTKLILLAPIILIMCDLMFIRKNICIQPFMPFGILFRGLSMLHIFLMANFPA